MCVVPGLGAWGFRDRESWVWWCARWSCGAGGSGAAGGGARIGGGRRGPGAGPVTFLVAGPAVVFGLVVVGVAGRAEELEVGDFG